MMTDYTGDVTPGGPAAVRTLGDLTISKISVGPMDNNAYLLRCASDGTQVLIDAANDAPTLLALIGDAAGAPEVSGPTRSIAAWLAGRADGTDLTVSPDGELPQPTRWK